MKMYINIVCFAKIYNCLTMKTSDLYSLYFKIVVLGGFSFLPSVNLSAQEEGYCSIFSREAWAGYLVALNKFMSGCGVIDTVSYDSLNRPVKTVGDYQAITMKLNSGKVMYRDSIYFVTDQMPEFNGGMEGLYKYLTKNIHYPDGK